jgi:hypothetical protein
MKTLLIGTISGIAITLSAVAHGASDTATASEQVSRSKQMDECFKAHATLMEKPAVKNRINCWMAHRHLMRG